MHREVFKDAFVEKNDDEKWFCSFVNYLLIKISISEKAISSGYRKIRFVISNV